MLLALSLASLLSLVPGADGLRLGETAPDFALRELDGREQRLADLRGRVVVLEWTSHLCPAVAGAHEPGFAADARAALADERVAWLMIDSSWFAPELADGVRAWRRRLALDAPYLLDTSGAVARRYGAAATPEYFVIDAEGVVRYRGALHDGAAEPERRNHVVETARALLMDREPPAEGSPARGCTLKLGPPAEGANARAFDEDGRAFALQEEAARHVSEGRSEAALAALERSFEAGHPRPWTVLADPAFRELIAEGEPRLALRSMLSGRTARGALRLVAPGEPGEPLVLCGTVRDESGDGIADAVVGLYHTDAAGWYSAASTAGENARLMGAVRTDRDGRWRVRTILPGHYADAREAPRHVHMSFRAERFREHAGHRASLFFEDDPRLVGGHRAEIEADGCAIRPTQRNAEGLALCVYDVVLRRE